MNDENFVYYKGSNGKIMAGGYEIKSELLQGGAPAIKSIKSQKGGGNIQTLAVPAGLFLLQQSFDSNANTLPILEKYPQIIEESLYSRLLDLVKPEKASKRKSRKLRKRKKKRKTRRRS